MPRDIPILLPDLELPEARAVVVAWLVKTGDRVVEGDRLVEVLAGEAAIDIDSPASGILLEQRVAPSDSLSTGQILGVIRHR